jgi:hypothetical protein
MDSQTDRPLTAYGTRPRSNPGPQPLSAGAGNRESAPLASPASQRNKRRRREPTSLDNKETSRHLPKLAAPRKGEAPQRAFSPESECESPSP